MAGLIAYVLCLGGSWYFGRYANPPVISVFERWHYALPALLTFVLVLSFVQAHAFPRTPRARWWAPAHLGGLLLGLIAMMLTRLALETATGYGLCGGSIGGLSDQLIWIPWLAINGLIGGLAALPLALLTGAVLLGMPRAASDPVPRQRWLPRLATLGVFGLSVVFWYPQPSKPIAPVEQLRTLPCWYTGPTNAFGLGKVYGTPATGGPDDGYYQPPQLRCSDKIAEGAEGRWRWVEGSYQPGWVLDANLQRSGTGSSPAAPQPSQYQLGGIEAGGTVIAAGWLPGGHELFVATSEAGLRVWSAGGAAEPRQVDLGTRDLLGAALSPDGQQFLIADQAEVIRLIEAASGQVLASLKHPVMLDELVTGVYFSPDGRLALAAWTDGNIRVWDRASKAETLDLWGSERITGVVMTPDGRTIVSAQFGNGLQLWDAASGNDTRKIGPPRYRVTSLAISPNGTSLLVGSSDGVVRRWELANGQQLGELFQPFDTPATSLAFSPDGKTALAGSADGMIVLWDVASGRELRRLAGHTNLLSSLAFSPGGTTVLSGSWDGTLRVWQVV